MTRPRAARPVPNGGKADIQAAFRRRLPPPLRWASRPIGWAIGLDAALQDWDSVSHLQGQQFVDAVLDEIGVVIDCPIAPDVAATREGPLVVVVNHHLGMLDGLVALSLVLALRPDAVGLGNRMLAAFPQMDPVLIPVPPPSAGSASTSEIRMVLKHLQLGRALVVFPSGQVAARLHDGTVSDGPWSPKVGRLIQRARADVLTIGIEGRNSALFYTARAVHFRLGTAMLLRELMKKRNQRIPVHVGRRIPYSELAGITDPSDLMEILRDATYASLPTVSRVQDQL